MSHQALDPLLFFLGFSLAATRISKPFKTSNQQLHGLYRCKSKEAELKGGPHGMEFYLSQGKHKARSESFKLFLLLPLLFGKGGRVGQKVAFWLRGAPTSCPERLP